MRPGSLTRRLTAAMALLLLLFGAAMALLAWRTMVEREQETLQRLSYRLAQHIVDHWPDVVAPDGDDAATRQALMRMLMTVNPAIQVYLLDEQGRVQAYIGEPGMVRVTQVDRDALRRFLAGAALPILGTDPMGSGQARVFSAAMFTPRAGVATPAGYLYIVLEGPARDAVAAGLAPTALWRSLGLALALAFGLTLGIALFVFRRLARPLARLASHVRAFELGQSLELPTTGRSSDEIDAMAQAFDGMSHRIVEQHNEQQRLAAAHREVIANVAHDLRTPLTALHGHLEALGNAELDATRRERHQGAALAQSKRVRRLVQQLFELASLQSIETPPILERFRIDEVVADTVHQFSLVPPQHRVALAGATPGPVELDGDLSLIERAIANLIDNALRHAPSAAPVQVRLRCNEVEVAVLVEDRGPGMPAELARRLDLGAPVRDPALRRHRGGGMGGLGLAIAQRVATLHGGRLHTLPSPLGGTTLCLALPRPRAAA